MINSDDRWMLLSEIDQARAPERRRSRRPAPNDPEEDSRFWRLWTIGAFFLAGILVWLAAPASWRGSPTTPVTTTTSNAPVPRRAETPLPTWPIEQIHTGYRVAGQNPIRAEADLIEPDPETWRLLEIEMRKASGLRVWIELLRPLAWIETRGASPGNTIQLNLPEMGAEGAALVTDILPCPEIHDGPGAVVTGTFRHEVGDDSHVLNLQFAGETQPHGVTENHPYWSVDRQEFVPAGELRQGERVDTFAGITTVESITPRPGARFLYNLETTEHVFRVGEFGTLVHNSSAMPVPTRFIDNVTVVDKHTGKTLTGTVDLKPTLDRIKSGSSFPHKRDGSVFRNSQSLLPDKELGYYKGLVDQ